MSDPYKQQLNTPYSVTSHLEKAVELLCLLAIVTVAFVFVPPKEMLSEAINAYVEVPKTTILRFIVGLISMIWILELTLKGYLSRIFEPRKLYTSLKQWLSVRSTRWLVICAVFYIAANIITTLTSVPLLQYGSLLSVWGEVSGQYGYSAYTTLSYFILFLALVTHIKTKRQLYRLLATIAFSGIGIAFYAILQHYCLDPFNIGEGGCIRVSTTMANPVFAGAFLVATSLFTIGISITLLEKFGWTPLKVLLAILVISSQFIAVYWTGSRGSWLMGVPAGLISFSLLAWLGMGVKGFAKYILLTIPALLLAALIVLGPAPSSDQQTDPTETSAITQFGDRFSQLKTDATGRGLSYRTDIWFASYRLVRDRTWFADEDLSIPVLRPLLGYGPEMFKYTFPLQSHYGGLLSHAHNFFVHHLVEQGLLGLTAVVSLFFLFFVTGLRELLRKGHNYSKTHIWLLLTMLATVSGRLAEMQVGVAREPDLVFLWVFLAAFVILPEIFAPIQHTGENISVNHPVISTRKSRRSLKSRTVGNQMSHPILHIFGKTIYSQFSLISVLIVLLSSIAWLTWDKNVNYFRAGIIAANGSDQFYAGKFQEAEQLMTKAAYLGDDVPIYYNNVSGIFLKYREYAEQNPEAQLPTCQDFFGLDPSPNDSHPGSSYYRCAIESYLWSLKGHQANPTSPQNKLSLANATLELAVMDLNRVKETNYPCNIDCADEALQYYRELLAMLPWSVPMHSAYVNGTIRLGIPESSLPDLETYLKITPGNNETGQIKYFIGMVMQHLGRYDEAITNYESSMEFMYAREDIEIVAKQAVGAYNFLAANLMQQQKSGEAIPILDKSLALSDDDNVSATILYLKGLAYSDLGAVATAVDYFQYSLDKAPNGQHVAEIHNQLAIAHEKLGNTALANEHSQQHKNLTGN